MSFFVRAFTGHYRLWQIFWGGVVASIVLQLLLNELVKVVPAFFYPVAIFTFIFGLWWIISVWRSAFLCNFKLWAYLARIWCALSLIGMTAGLALTLTAGPEIVTVVEQAAEETPVETPVEAAAPVVETTPVTEAVSVVPETPAPAPTAEEQCTERLRAYATQNNADADAYVAKNRTWIDSCVQKATAAQ